MEQFYTVQEIASAWKLSVKAIRTLFKDEPGVMKFVGPGLLEGTAKRPHITLRIPESALNRVHERLVNPVGRRVITLPRTHRRIVRLRSKPGTH